MNENELLQAALEYAKRGWPVFPCEEQGNNAKKPYTEHGFKDASSDEEAIRQWWRRWPNALIGTPTGYNFWVLDVDLPNGPENLRRLEEQHGELSAVMAQRTQSGGTQLFFRCNGQKVRNSVGRIADNLDVRGVGGYCILPPSKVLDGGQYQWIDQQPPVEAPKWIVSKALEANSKTSTTAPTQQETILFKKTNDAYAERALANEIAYLSGIGPDSRKRNDSLNTAAFNLGQLIADGLLDQFRVEAALLAASVANGLPSDEARRTIHSGIEAGMRRPRGKAAAAWEPAAAEAEQQASKFPPRRELRITDNEWNMARLTPTCIVQDYLYTDLAVLVAPGGTGKTTVYLYEAIHIVLGRPLYGLEVKKTGWILILTAEDPRDICVARLREICRAMDLNQEEVATVRRDVVILDVSGSGVKLILMDDGNVVVCPDVETLIEQYRDDPPVMVVIDPTVSFGVSEGKVNDNEQGLVNSARKIRNSLGCCVRFVHHTSKNSARAKTLDQYTPRGGSALPDGSRMVAVMQPWSRGESNPPPGCDPDTDSSITILARAKLSYARAGLPKIWIRRTGWEFEHFIEEQPVLDEEFERALKDQLCRFITSQVAAGIKHSQTSLEACAATIGFKRQKFRDVLAILVAEGRVVKKELPKKERQGGKTTFFSVK